MDLERYLGGAVPERLDGRPLVSEPARAVARPDGSFVLVDAPPLAEFGLAWLATTGSANVVVDEAGNIRLGPVTYRPLYFQRQGANPSALLMLVCERVDL